MYEFVGPDDWVRSSLFDLATWKNGLAFKNIQFSDSGDPVIKIAELKSGITEQTKFTRGEYGDEVRVEPGDMLFSWSGNPDTSIDVFEWDGPPGWLNQHIYKVTPAEGVDRDFLFFLLKWLKPRFAEIARNKQTTGLGHVTLADFKQMQIGLPKPDEQAAIVALVKPYHDKIELNRRMNATLEAMARAIFRDWFVDFGPTRAKAEGREPYLAPDLWPLFPARLDDEGKPEGWEVSEIGKETTAVGGSTPSTKEPSYWGGGVNWATPKDLSPL
ncbi:restriction endonuclease subunit S, partial [Ruegeria intermedia]